MSVSTSSLAKLKMRLLKPNSWIKNFKSENQYCSIIALDWGDRGHGNYNYLQFS